MFDELVRDPDALRRACASLRGERWIALDTEFVRERTYYPRLCLLQVATPTRLLAIDALALPDLEPLLELLYDRALFKVLHAARQDLEILYYLRRGLPAPLFDTQLAAAFAGLPEQMSYADLVQALLGVKLEKGATRTDWGRRPLTEAQLRYAAEDVRYLGALHAELAARLTALGRTTWLEQECARLTDPALYHNDPQTAYTRIRQAQALAATGQQVVRTLACWREASAQRRNLPRAWVLADAVLLELASRQPRSVRELRTINGLSAGTLRHHAAELLDAIAEGMAAAPVALYARRTRPTPAQSALYRRLAASVAERARAHGVSATLIAARADIEAFIASPDKSLLAQGWRREILGEEFLEVRNQALPTAGTEG